VTSHQTAGGEQSPVVTAIHIAPARRLPMRAVESVRVEAGLGIVGDRYHGSMHRRDDVRRGGSSDPGRVVHRRRRSLGSFWPPSYRASYDLRWMVEDGAIVGSVSPNSAEAPGSTVATGTDRQPSGLPALNTRAGCRP
jgi:hypothetical protein